MGQMNVFLIACISILCFSIHGDAQKQRIGVNNGMSGTNLPSQEEVVALLKANNIGKYRIFKQEPSVFKAFANSGIELTVGVATDDLQRISSNQNEANKWVNENIKAHYPATNIKYIAVGNEVLGKTDKGQFLVGAMNNIQTALQNANLQGKIKVSTTHALTDIIGPFAPLNPSKGSFTAKVQSEMRSVLQFLAKNGSPFMANVYTYFTYDSNRDSYNIDNALFKPSAPANKNGDPTYTSLFIAMVDTVYSAMEGMSYPNIPIVVTESGWPSHGTGVKASIATIENARSYNSNLIKHVLSNKGTPKRPGKSMETFIFALFNEDLKGGDETEKHYGLFYANKSPVYPVNFTP
ncbi:hypothetical protein SUGI_0326510 [Cryptomeria japonica]|uniref:glucan endo-1,3-beta-glucosidase n=1 Tax=Cryptomeria japonica TaxID=3369 RepID=UPI002408ADAF|nr:glucan endo-1,3-beta-glucosidase [Cryptomeria japonica]GLJ18426.1 hypothetical protein SUGI_0326510 [Cryptomeria japonica]